MRPLRGGGGTGDGAARVTPSRPPDTFGPIPGRGRLGRAFPRTFRAATACGDQPGEVVVDALDMGDEGAEQLLAFEVALGEAVQRLGLEAHQLLLQGPHLRQILTSGPSLLPR